MVTCPDLRPVPVLEADLKNKYEKYDVAMAKKLMAAAGQSKGFAIKLSTFSTPLDFAAVAALIQTT